MALGTLSAGLGSLGSGMGVLGSSLASVSVGLLGTPTVSVQALATLTPTLGASVVAGGRTFVGTGRVWKPADFSVSGWLSATGRRLGMWGSSGEAICGSTKLDLFTDVGTGALNINADGYLLWANVRWGSPLALRWNGAVAGSSAPSILTAFETEFPTHASNLDVVLLKPFANTFADQLGTYATYKTRYRDAVATAVAAGKKVILVTPHTRNPMTAPMTQYLALEEDNDLIVTEYPDGTVLHWNLFRAGSPDGVSPCRVDWLVDGVHLNIAGSIAICAHDDHIGAWFGGDPDLILNQFGVEPTMRVAPGDLTTTVTMTAGATRTRADGMSETLYTTTGNGGHLQQRTPRGTRTAGNTYRTWVDLEIVDPGAASTLYMAGASDRGGATATTSNRLLGITGASGSNQLIPAGTRMRVLSPPWTMAAAHISDPRLRINGPAPSGQAWLCEAAEIPVTL